MEEPPRAYVPLDEDEHELQRIGDDHHHDDGAPVANPAGAPPRENFNPIGLYGWRKRCLYFLILLLVVVLIVNLGLTIWILVVLDFNVHGMGNLRITNDGVTLQGTADFIGPLFAKNISTQQGSPLYVTSDTEVGVRIPQGSSLQLDNTTINLTTSSFHLHTQDQAAAQLSVTNDRVEVSAAQLQVTGARGVSVSGPLQTSRVSSHPNQHLSLQALSGELNLIGGEGVRISDGPASSGMTFTSDQDMTISSQSGQITLSAQTIELRGLPGATQGVHEVCVCNSGALFLVPANTNCGNHNNLCSE